MLRLWAVAVVLASPMMMRDVAAAAVHLELQLHPVLGPYVLVSRLPPAGCGWQSAVLLSARKRFCEWIQPYDMFAAVDSAAEVPCCTAFWGSRSVADLAVSGSFSRTRGLPVNHVHKRIVQLQMNPGTQETLDSSKCSDSQTIIRPVQEQDNMHKPCAAETNMHRFHSTCRCCLCVALCHQGHTAPCNQLNRCNSRTLVVTHIMSPQMQ